MSDGSYCKQWDEDEVKEQLNQAKVERDHWKQRAESAERLLESMKVAAEVNSRDKVQLAEALAKSGQEHIALRERAEAAEATLRKANTPFEDADKRIAIQRHKDGYYWVQIEGGGSHAPYTTWREAYRDASMIISYGDAVRRAEAAEKACAEMREVLKEAYKFIDPVVESSDCKSVIDLMIVMDKALSSTAGTGYLSPGEVKEAVKPLVEALDSYSNWKYATNALAYAKEKGWV